MPAAAARSASRPSAASDGGHGCALALIGRDEDGGAAGGQLRFEGPAAEALVREQVARGRRGFQQVDRDVALADGGGHGGLGPHDPAAQVVLTARRRP